MTTAEPSTSGGPTGGTPRARDSRWWYWIAALPAFTVLGTVVSAAMVALVLTGAVLGVGAGPRLAVPVVVGLAIVLAVVGIGLSVALPVALYRDVELVTADPGVDWAPDRDLFVLLGVVGIFVGPVGTVTALYYLYRRHDRLGVP